MANIVQIMTELFPKKIVFLSLLACHDCYLADLKTIET